MDVRDHMVLAGPADEARRKGDRGLADACDEGIVTLADDRFFVGLVLLYLSVQQNYPVPIVCFDGGLTEAQKTWARDNLPACSIRPIPDTQEIRHVRDSLRGTSANQTEEWLLWVCPFLIASSPFRRALWLDADLVVLRRLGQLFQFMEQGPVFTLENHNPPDTPNLPELYHLLPIDRQFNRDVPLINGGVSGWDLVRDAELLSWYGYPVMQAAKDPRIKAAIKWHDQGSLIWALQKTGNEERVLKSRHWNLCAEHVADPEKPYRPTANLLDELRKDYPATNLVHWNGFLLENKLGARLGPEAEVLNVLQGLLPGRGRFGPRKEPPEIHLMSYIGSKSGPWLIQQFLDHYALLGVHRFLIILQGEEGDPRLDEARGVLAGRGIRPVMETPVFSAPLKHERFLEIQRTHCGPDDWILTADVDELQVFPEPLPDLLRRCDGLGYTFVPGRFVDRISADGTLPTIRPGLSLWDQFPFGAAVTSQVSGGWTHKVCAAKGRLRLADGGSHAIDYGVDGRRNYATTHRDPHAYPVPVEVHHFKWDSGLVQRVQEKIQGVGGDLDGKDGKEFMHEYRALQSHLERFGRLHVRGSRYLGRPELHYIRSSVRGPYPRPPQIPPRIRASANT